MKCFYVSGADTNEWGCVRSTCEGAKLGPHQASEESLGNESILVLVLFHFIIKFLMGAGKGTSVVMCVLK